MNRVKLGDILRIKHGYAFKSENYVDKSQYALVTLANISGSNNFQFTPEKTTYYGAEFPDEFKLYEDDLIMPLTEQVVGLFGNSAFVPNIKGIQFVLNQRVGKVIPDESKADKYYLHYLLSTDSVRDQLEYRASGTRQRNISPDDVYDVTVFIPNIEKQRKIGKILYDLERKINLNNKINDNLQCQIKLMYDYWFTQFDFPDENGNPYRSSGGAMVWNEQLKRDIPIYWCASSVSLVYEILSGFPFSSEFYVPNGKYKLLTIKNVQDTGINLNVDNCVDQIPSKMPDYCMLKPLDILMSLTGNVGRIGIFYSNNCLLNQRVALVRSINQEMNGYVYFLLKSDLMRKQLETIANGSSQQNLSPIEAEKIIIPYNPELAIKYSKYANKSLNIIANNLAENERLTQLRDCILPMLMNGQVSFTDEKEEKPQIKISGFEKWLANQGFAARGDVDMDVLRNIYEAMDNDDK